MVLFLFLKIFVHEHVFHLVYPTLSPLQESLSAEQLLNSLYTAQSGQESSDETPSASARGEFFLLKMTDGEVLLR